MGRGDRKTAKGKRFSASHGNVRAKGAASIATAGAVAVTTKAPVVKKAPAKKAAAKKA